MHESPSKCTVKYNICIQNGGIKLSGKRINLCRIFTDGDYTLYADVPELVPTYDLPPNHQYLGPVLWSPAGELPRWWDSLRTDRPIVYATLGTSGGKNLLQVVLGFPADPAANRFRPSGALGRLGQPIGRYKLLYGNPRCSLPEQWFTEFKVTNIANTLQAYWIALSSIAVRNHRRTRFTYSLIPGR
ncbi:glycosyltransferase [Actinomadura welshii]